MTQDSSISSFRKGVASTGSSLLGASICAMQMAAISQEKWEASAQGGRPSTSPRRKAKSIPYFDVRVYQYQARGTPARRCCKCEHAPSPSPPSPQLQKYRSLVRGNQCNKNSPLSCFRRYKISGPSVHKLNSPKYLCFMMFWKVF